MMAPTTLVLLLLIGLLLLAGAWLIGGRGVTSCPRCQRRCRGAARFCGHCGVELRHPAKPPEPHS